MLIHLKTNTINIFCNCVLFTIYTRVIMNPSTNIAVVHEAGTVGQINSLFFVQTKAAEKADSTRRHSKGGTCPGFQAVGSL